MKKGNLWELFLTFGKIGLFTFGGGYAMIPLIQREAVENKKWIKEEELLDLIAIAESTPGPIAVNASTYIGKKTSGTKGAICATLGVVLPSFLMMIGISFILEAFQRARAVQYAFWGIRAGVLALILKALWSMFRQCRKHWFEICVMILAFAAAAIIKVHSILVILICAMLGILWSRNGKEKQ